MENKLFNGGKPFGKGMVGAELNDPDLVDFISAYRRRVAGNYRPLLLNDFGALPASGLLVSTKIDGELWFLVSLKKEFFLTNARGVVIYGDIPLLAQAKSIPVNTIIAGELFAQVMGRRSRVGDLAALLAEGDGAEVGNLSFAAFDLLRHTGILVDGTYMQRYEQLNQLISSSGPLSVVQSEEMDRNKLLTKFESEVVKGEIEGLVIRLPSGLIYKLKPSVTIDAAVIAYTTRSDQPGLARSILLGLMHPSGEIQILGGCGNLGSDIDRSALGKQLEKLKVDAPIRYASDSGSLYSFVKPELVVEIKVTDLQLERADGTNASTMILSYKGDSWSSGRLSQSPRPIHPVLVRVRDDKKVNNLDIRIEQIAGYMPKLKDAVLKVETAKSEILRREVWTKEAKGALAVRKLLVWKTNKNEFNSSHPSYVVHWTDYSPGRASPLDRDVKLAPDEKTAVKIANSMVEENIKKGWNKAV